MRGRTSSPAFSEPFAWAVAQHNATVVGAALDAQYRRTILGPDRLENCHGHPALSPSRSIVASCFVVERTAR